MSLSNVTKAAQAGAASVLDFAQIAQSKQDTFSQLLGTISGFGAFGGIGQLASTPELDQSGRPTGRMIVTGDSGAITVGDLLNRLAALIQAQRAAQQDPNQHINFAEFADSIAKTVALIREYGGEAARSGFNLQKFERFLDEQAAATGATGASAVQSVIATSNRGIGISGQPAPVVDEVTKDQKILDALGVTAAQLSADLAQATEQLNDANAAMQQLRETAGLDKADGAVAQLQKQLADAKETLQYFEDKGFTDRIDDQQKAVADLQSQLDDAEKQQRIADYEFEHSKEYQSKLQAIADAQAALDAKKKAVDENAAKIDVAQKSLDDAKKKAEDAASKLADASKDLKKAGAQISLDLKKQAEDLAKVATDGAKGLTLITAKSVQLITTAADDAAKKITTGVDYARLRSLGLIP